MPCSAVALLLFAIAGTSLWTSNYLVGVTQTGVIFDNGPRRLSILIGGLADYQRLRHQTGDDAVLQKAAAPTADPVNDCNNCPDIVILHSESNFDPTITPQFVDRPPLHKVLDEQVAGVSGLLMVNIWGGLS